MKPVILNKDVPILIIDDVFTQVEMDGIYKEVDYFISTNQLDFPNKSGSAMDGDRPLKANRALFLDEVYTDRKYSNILQHTRKIFNEETYSAFESLNPLYRGLRHTVSDNTLMSVYREGDYYEAHRDGAWATACFYLFDEPKNFTGGDVHFPEYDFTVEIENNTCILFPSFFLHQATPLKGSGVRVCLSKFINMQ